MEIFERDGKWYRLLREDEVIRDGDVIFYPGMHGLSSCSSGPLATPRQRNEVTQIGTDFYREVDYLTAQMIEVKKRAR